MNHTYLGALLATMADTPASWVLYLACVFQLAVAVALYFKRFRNSRIFPFIAAIALLIFPVLLAVGVYSATLPPA